MKRINTQKLSLLILLVGLYSCEQKITKIDFPESSYFNATPDEYDLENPFVVEAIGENYQISYKGDTIVEALDSILHIKIHDLLVSNVGYHEYSFQAILKLDKSLSYHKIRSLINEFRKIEVLRFYVRLENENYLIVREPPVLVGEKIYIDSLANSSVFPLNLFRDSFMEKLGSKNRLDLNFRDNIITVTNSEKDTIKDLLSLALNNRNHLVVSRYNEESTLQDYIHVNAYLDSIKLSMRRIVMSQIDYDRDTIYRLHRIDNYYLENSTLPTNVRN